MSAKYLSLLQQLLPPGHALTRDDDANLTDLLLGIATEFARVEGRADDLVDERDPSTITETLSDWERALGLPDCTAPTTTSGRRAAILARIVGVSAQDQAFYVAFANALGFTGARCVRRPYAPFVAGSLAGAPLTNMGNHSAASLTSLVSGPGWPYVWILDVIEPDQDDPVISDELDLILECQVGRINQDHAIVEHLYRLFATNGVGVASDHNNVLELYHPVTAEEMADVIQDAMPTVTVRGVEYMWCDDGGGADPVDNTRTSIPTQMLAHGWRVHLIPSFDSDDTDDHTVFAIGDTDGGLLELVPYSATQMVFRFYASHTADGIDALNLCAVSDPITFRSSDPITVTVDGQTGEITVTGARTGDATNDDGFEWNMEDAAGTLHIGKDA